MGKTQSRLSDEQIEKIKNNTNYTEKEIHEWYKGFIMDCPSGELTVHEFRRMYLATVFYYTLSSFFRSFNFFGFFFNWKFVLIFF
jgi:Ca2+-binding EF-hand superfamily protein